MSSEPNVPPGERFNFAQHLLQANAGRPARRPSSTTRAH
jgi:hypothetical protein